MTLDRLLNLWCTSPLQTSSQCPCNWQSSGFKSVLFVDTEILTLWRRAVKKASKTETCLRVCVSSSPKEKKRGLDGNGITWKSPSLVWLLQLVYWIPLISHLHGNSIYSFTSVQRSGISRGNWSKSTEEKRSVMPSPSATLTTQPSSLWEKATGGLRATKLHSEGCWGEVRVEGIGECCCVGSGWSLERLSIPQLLLAFSGMTRECEWGDTGEEESDQNHPKNLKPELELGTVLFKAPVTATRLRGYVVSSSSVAPERQDAQTQDSPLEDWAKAAKGKSSMESLSFKWLPLPSSAAE